jgi:DNA-binding transcriptional ArsR family regulator
MDTSPRPVPGRPGGDADLAAAAALIADPARARVLMALLDGRALPASGLAAEAGLSAPATTSHLNKLRAGGLIQVEVSGRHRYYRLTGPHVAAVLEALATIAPLQPIRSLRQDTHAGQLRAARSCYDHLAGRLGVAVTTALLNRRVLIATDGIDDTTRRPGDRLAAALPAHPYQLGPAAVEVFGDLGVDLPALLQAPRSARPLLRFCTDWTEQRHHLAGALGATLLTALCDSGCLIRRSRRIIWLTEHGAATLHEHLGVDLQAFSRGGGVNSGRAEARRAGAAQSATARTSGAARAAALTDGP